MHQQEVIVHLIIITSSSRTEILFWPGFWRTVWEEIQKLSWLPVRNFLSVIFNHHYSSVICLPSRAQTTPCSWALHECLVLFNHLHPNISMHILHTILSTFPLFLARRIWLTIKCFFGWWSFLLFLWPYFLIWLASHSEGLKVYKLQFRNGVLVSLWALAESTVF